MAGKELLEKNRFTEEEYKKKINEQWNQMLEDYFSDKEMEEIRKKQKNKLRKPNNLKKRQKKSRAL